MVLVGWWGVWLCQDHLSLSAPSAQQTSGEGIRLARLGLNYFSRMQLLLNILKETYSLCVQYVCIETDHRNKPYPSNAIDS